MLERGHVVRNLPNVFQWDAGRLITLVQEKVREGRLRALDLRGDQRFLADVRVDEQRRVRQERRQPIESSKRAARPSQGTILN